MKTKCVPPILISLKDQMDFAEGAGSWLRSYVENQELPLLLPWERGLQDNHSIRSLDFQGPLAEQVKTSFLNEWEHGCSEKGSVVTLGWPANPNREWHDLVVVCDRDRVWMEEGSEEGSKRSCSYVFIEGVGCHMDSNPEESYHIPRTMEWIRWMS